ncbi:MAG: hypothetical protein KDE27_15005 [Planctomycetes bacterium]|nr:hypothetical protein [Planctomycetota bacterium]
MTPLLRWILTAAALWAAALPAVAQGGRTKPGLVLDVEKVALQARFEPATARPGDTVKLIVGATVTPGWHAYGALETGNIPVSLEHDSLELHGLEAVGAASVPPGEEHTDALGTVTHPLPEYFEVSQKVKVPGGTAPGDVEITGQLGYQVCDENSCEAPTTDVFTAKLTVQAGEPQGQEPVRAQDPGFGGVGGFGDLDGDKVTVEARFEPATARAGETVKLVLGGTVTPGWHAYGSEETGNIPVSLDHDKLELHGLETAGDASVPPGEEHTDALGTVTHPLPEYFEVTQQLKVPADAKPGAIEISGRLDYQVCDENSCQAPTDAPFTATLTIEAGEARAPTAGVGEDDGAKAKKGPPQQKGAFDSLWALILACIGGGLFALAMPCTYPMIPITFSFFTKQAEKRHGSVLPLALTYGFGIVLMFVLVGVVLSSVIVPFVNHWATNLVIGLVFLFFSFVLFGWINFEPPRFLQNAAGKASGVGGMLGVFFMGAALVISSFTCTAPIVGSLIANVAQYGPVRVGFGMAIFGLTMAIPFVALALMPTKVKAMPRSGEWMETLKISLGFVELAAVLKFLSVVDLSLGWSFLNRELFLLLTGAIFLLWAMFLFGFLPKQGVPYAGVGAGRQATGMFVVLFAVYLLSGAMGHRLDFYTTSFAPPYSASFVEGFGPGSGGAGGEGDGHGVATTGHIIIKDDPVRALEVAKAEDKLLLYNFTGFN